MNWTLKKGSSNGESHSKGWRTELPGISLTVRLTLATSNYSNYFPLVFADKTQVKSGLLSNSFGLNTETPDSKINENTQSEIKH